MKRCQCPACKECKAPKRELMRCWHATLGRIYLCWWCRFYEPKVVKVRSS